jgi:hypothetical protein
MNFGQLRGWASTTPRWSGSGFTRLVVELADLPGELNRVCPSNGEAEFLLGCQFVTSRRRFYVPQLARFLEFWLNANEWSDERHSGGGF